MIKRAKRQIILEGVVMSDPTRFDEEIRIPFKYTSIKTHGINKRDSSEIPSIVDRVDTLILKNPHARTMQVTKGTKIRSYHDLGEELPKSASWFAYSDKIGIFDRHSNKECVFYVSTITST